MAWDNKDKACCLNGLFCVNTWTMSSSNSPDSKIGVESTKTFPLCIKLCDETGISDSTSIKTFMSSIVPSSSTSIKRTFVSDITAQIRIFMNKQ